MCKKVTFEVLDCKVEGILGMPFLKYFNLEIDWTTGATIINRYTIPLVEHEAYISSSRLEIVISEAFIKGFKQGKYTWYRYMDSLLTVP